MAVARGACCARLFQDVGDVGQGHGGVVAVLAAVSVVDWGITLSFSHRAVSRAGPGTATG